MQTKYHCERFYLINGTKKCWRNSGWELYNCIWILKQTTFFVWKKYQCISLKTVLTQMFYFSLFLVCLYEKLKYVKTILLVNIKIKHQKGSNLSLGCSSKNKTHWRIWKKISKLSIFKSFSNSLWYIRERNAFYITIRS